MKIIFLISSILRTFVSILILPWVSLFSKKVKKRLRSENLSPLKKQYFDKEYDAIFHVSSQGEWQQVRPVFEEFKDLRVLILYSSESLTKEITLLEKAVDIAMLPVLSFRLTQNVSHLRTKQFFMVRYDFFPELMILANKTHSVLIAATLKSKSLSIFNSCYWKSIYSSFDIIFCCSEKDSVLFKSLLSNNKKILIKNFDFRHQAIIKRQMSIENPSILGLENWLSDTPKDKRLICGSFWASEVFLFSGFDLVDKKMKVLIAPHQLKGQECDNLIKKLEEKFPSLFILSHPSELKELKEHRIVINLLPNILCESYCLFGHAYVGGGFGRSVHSLLEPFWGGCHVYLGPKTHRSTE